MPDVNSSDHQPTELERRLRVALDHMPGALVYTDAEQKIVFCNERFKEMYRVPEELLQPGRPYADFCAIWPSTATTARVTSMRWSRRRVESLRNPSGRSFEDHAPDGRWYRIFRRRVAEGGTVTVMTDITDQKQAEQDLADREAKLHVALDNMPGALAYTDDELRIVVCNDRFREMYIVPPELLQPGRPYADLLRYLAENGYYGEVTSMPWSRGAWRACATLRGRASRTTRRTAAGIACCAGGWRQAARSR